MSAKDYTLDSNNRVVWNYTDGDSYDPFNRRMETVHREKSQIRDGGVTRSTIERELDAAVIIKERLVTAEAIAASQFGDQWREHVAMIFNAISAEVSKVEVDE